MKLLILLVSISYPCIGFSQIVEDELQGYDTLLEKNISNMLLADDQYFNLSHSDYIVLYTIVPESALKKKDSLLKEAQYLNREILKNAGPSIGNKEVYISYTGSQSDSGNISFKFLKNEYLGSSKYHITDTVLSLDKNVIARSNNIGWGTFVRKIKLDDDVHIVFKVITRTPKQSITGASSVKLAMGFLLDYLGNSYRQYSILNIVYFDQYGRYRLLYECDLDGFILSHLNQYYKECLNTIMGENKVDSNQKYRRSTIYKARAY
jgi:hypothetical protein